MDGDKKNKTSANDANPFAAAFDDVDAGVADPVDAGLAEYQRAHDAGAPKAEGTTSVATPDTDDPVLKRLREAELAKKGGAKSPYPDQKDRPSILTGLDPSVPFKEFYKDYGEGAYHSLTGGTYANKLFDSAVDVLNRGAQAAGFPHADHTIDGQKPRYAGRTPSGVLREKPVERARERSPEGTAEGEAAPFYALGAGGRAGAGTVAKVAKEAVPVARNIVRPFARLAGDYVSAVPGASKYVSKLRGAGGAVAGAAKKGAAAAQKYVKEAAEALPEAADYAAGVGRAAQGLGTAALARGAQIEDNRVGQVASEFAEDPVRTAVVAAAPVLGGAMAGRELSAYGQRLKDRGNEKLGRAFPDRRLDLKAQKHGAAEEYRRMGKLAREMGLDKVSKAPNDNWLRGTSLDRLHNNVQDQIDQRGADVARARQGVMRSTTGHKRTLPDGTVVDEEVGQVKLPTERLASENEANAQAHEYANAPDKAAVIREHQSRLQPQPAPQPPTDIRAPIPRGAMELIPHDASRPPGPPTAPPPPPPPPAAPTTLPTDLLPSSGAVASQRPQPPISGYRGQPPRPPMLGPEPAPPTGVGAPHEPGVAPVGPNPDPLPPEPTLHNRPYPPKPTRGANPQPPSEVPVALRPLEQELARWDQEQELAQWPHGELPATPAGNFPTKPEIKYGRATRQAPKREPSPTAKPEPRKAGAKAKAPTAPVSRFRGNAKPKPEPTVDEQVKEYQLDRPKLLGPQNPPPFPQVVEPNQMKLDTPRLSLGGPQFQETSRTAPRINLLPAEQRDAAEPSRLQVKPRPMTGIPRLQEPALMQHGPWPEPVRPPFQSPSLLREPDPILPPHRPPKGSYVRPPNKAPRINLMPTEQRVGGNEDVPRLQLRPFPFPGITSPNVPITGVGPRPQLSLGAAPQYPPLSSGPKPSSAPMVPRSSLVPKLSLTPPNRPLPESTPPPAAAPLPRDPGPPHFTINQADEVQRDLMSDLTRHEKKNNVATRAGEDEAKRPLAYGIKGEKESLLEELAASGAIPKETYDAWKAANEKYSFLKDIEDPLAIKAASEQRGTATQGAIHQLLGDQRTLHGAGSIAETIGDFLKSPNTAKGVSAGVSGYMGSKKSGQDYRDANEKLKKELQEDQK